MIDELIRLFGKFAPQDVIDRVLKHAKVRIREERREKEEGIPKVPLKKRNVQNCKLILNRIELLSKLKSCGNVAEVGVASGEFSTQIISETRPDKLHLIDIWGSDRYGEEEYCNVQRRLESEIDSGVVNVHRSLSTAAASKFDDRYFDWVYIDTDHSYETTKQELRAYAPKVKEEGVIAGHDYTLGNWVEGYRYGVIEAVHEFCVQHNWELLFLTAEPIENRSFAIRRIRQ
jgi:predicted O-methyltransferase YrrM